MQIANPIYDVVFKYLLEDTQVAKLMLSTLLGEEVTELTFKPQEHATKVGLEKNLTVYRIDFAATIKNDRGEYRQALIEIQKAKFDTDIMRFRRYLGNQYRDANNVEPTPANADHAERKKALPLVTIYFLGHALAHTDAPVIRVARECRDLATGEPLKEKEYFIESLTHDSYIVQIPRLRPERRNALEAMLQVFDQKNIRDDKHRLEIDENQIEEVYRPILRRLQRAIAEEEVVYAMDVEDEILEEMQELERKIEQERAEKERERAEKEHALAEKAHAVAEREHALAEKAHAVTEREYAMAEKAHALAEKERLLTLLKQAGIDYSG